MGRYTGPKTKIARRFGEPIYGPDKHYERRKYPPGLHGRARKRRKMSVYGMQLNEKQKAKYIYGLYERQFRKLFKEAQGMKGKTGENLLQLLESRLDNVVYRLGIAPSRPAARQLVTHKHILVNGRVVNIPSYLLKPGDIVAVREKSKTLEVIQNSIKSGRGKKYPWIEWDENLLAGKFLYRPTREEIPENINELLIVELYSK